MSKGTRDERAWSSALEMWAAAMQPHPGPSCTSVLKCRVCCWFWLLWSHGGFGIEFFLKKYNNLGEEKTLHLDIIEALHSGEL